MGLEIVGNLRRLGRCVLLVWIALSTLVANGLFVLLGLSSLRENGPLYRDETLRQIEAPGGRASARLYKTQGGFGTVHSIKVQMTDAEGQDWLIYKAKDSDSLPTIRWINESTLQLTPPCERFEYVSNPDDWAYENLNPQRLKVRVAHARSCPE